MIRIEKSKEPNSWTQHRLTEGATYEATSDLRDSLLADQGYICAYCMRRIPVHDKGSTETTRIEHIIPQSRLTREEAMDYRNLVICCPGASTSTSESECHCDRHKGEKPISFTPLDKNFINTITYKTDGSICSTNSDYNKELNEILNLNAAILKANRKAVRKQLINSLGKKDWKKEISKNSLRSIARKTEMERKKSIAE